MRLFYHKTDGGAEYLCSEAVEGTQEGKIPSKLIVRIDGDIKKDAELITGMPDEKISPISLKREEDYLFKIVNRVIEWTDVFEASQEDVSELVMSELINYKK